MNRDELLQHLLDRYFDQSATPADLRRLNDLLRDPSARQVFWDAAGWQALLRASVELGRSLDAGEYRPVIPTDTKPPAPTPEMPKADPSGFFPALWNSLPSVLDGRTPRATFWILFVLVGSLLFGSFGWLVWSSRPDMHVTDAPKPPKQVQPEEPEYAVAYLGDQEGAVWADGAQGIPSGGRGFFEGKTAELTSGLAQINFKDGAEVVVEGPCKITFQGRNAALLEQGKLSATVEMSSAKGFIIDTPFGTVTDLGTEFGVEVTEETIDVGVYRGKVSMAVAASGEVVRLTAGQTARADRQGNVTSGSGQPERLAIVREIRRPTKQGPAEPTPPGGPFTFVDAVPGVNTHLDGPGSFGPTTSTSTTVAADGKWSVIEFQAGSGSTVLATHHTENATPRLATTFTLPTAGIYEIRGYFWNNKNGTGAWDVAFQLGAGGTMTPYTKANATDLSATTGHFTTSVPVHGKTGGVLCEASLGTWNTATDGFTVTVYVDDPQRGDTPASQEERTWYDGVGYRSHHLTNSKEGR